MKNPSVDKLTEELLSIVAPEEIFLLDGYDPKSPAAQSTSSGPLGFGATEAISLIFPFVYSFFSKFVESVGSEAGKRALSSVIDYIKHSNNDLSTAARVEISDYLLKEGLTEEKISAVVDGIVEVLKKNQAILARKP